MKAVILAGGLGTRISEETNSRPKPMVEIGGRPILWHIMKIYSHYGINEFIICAGYKGYLLKEYFANYFLHTSDVTFDISGNKIQVHQRRSEDWRVTVVDTGETTMTGGRLRRVRDYIGNDTFCFTYGDGVGDVNIKKSIEFHKQHARKATITGVKSPNRFGVLEIQDHQIVSFQEKPEGESNWINGGFFVLEPSVIDFISDDNCVWERSPLGTLASQKELMIYKHLGYWQPMDTLREKIQLEELWSSGKAPWKVWS